MNRECWRTVFFLVVLIFFTLFVRIVFLQPNAEFIELQADYYQKAMIGSQGVYKLQGFGIDEWYTKILSVCMLFFLFDIQLSVQNGLQQAPALLSDI